MQDLEQTFKRGQVEWALWQLFAANSPSPARPPQAFLTRIKRLWELDRRMGPEAPGYAFFDQGPHRPQAPRIAPRGLVLRGSRLYDGMASERGEWPAGANRVLRIHGHGTARHRHLPADGRGGP